MKREAEAGCILVVDDEAGVRISLRKVLRKAGHDVSAAADGEKALDAMKTGGFDVVVTDFQMPGMTGLELLKRVKAISPAVEIVLVTGHGTIERAVDAMKEGAYDYITKPFKRDDILRIVTKALEKRRLSQEIVALREELSDRQKDRAEFIGRAPEVRSILTLVDSVARTSSSVLINGESGTGKEVIARRVHLKSARARKKFIAVNCGAIAENLVESELFGHVKGAFTGAMRDKDGLFKIASGGTLFLDEISTIPLQTQIKLLRVLQEKEILPVGGTKPISVDVRIISASNRDLTELIEQEKFREDLFYRVNVVEIEIPPLRERKEDIPLLVEHFLKMYNVEMNKRVAGVSREVLEVFYGHDWKGNVRELGNALERAMILCVSDTIRLEHLPPIFKKVAPVSAPSASLKDAVSAFEREQILQAIDAAGSDKKAAAKSLGLSLSSLYRKLSELGMEVRE